MKALETGADDFVSKPFSHLELLARMQAVLRRTQNTPLGMGEAPFIVNGLCIDFEGHEVTVNGGEVKLTPTEFGILRCLVKNSGRIMSASNISHRVWGDDVPDANQLIKVHIQHLRKKIGDDPAKPHYIFTERGVGYKFVRLA